MARRTGFIVCTTSPVSWCNGTTSTQKGPGVGYRIRGHLIATTKIISGRMEYRIYCLHNQSYIIMQRATRQHIAHKGLGVQDCFAPSFLYCCLCDKEQIRCFHHFWQTRHFDSHGSPYNCQVPDRLDQSSLRGCYFVHQHKALLCLKDKLLNRATRSSCFATN